MSKQDKDMGNVHQLHRDKAAKIEPPDGYTPPAGMYMQAAGGEPLVRLFDVFEWLQRDGRMPAKAAAAAICDVLQPLAQEACEWLFTGLSNDYASPVDAQAEYCACGRLLVIDLENYYQRCSTCPPGVNGLLKIVSSSWVNGPEYYGYGVGLDVCLPQAKAHELWAWGRPAKDESKATGQPAPAGESLKPKKQSVDVQKLISRRNELFASGDKAFAANAAKEFGLKTRDASRLVKKYSDGGVMERTANDLVRNKNKAA